MKQILLGSGRYKKPTIKEMSISRANYIFQLDNHLKQNNFVDHSTYRNSILYYRYYYIMSFNR